MGCAEDLYYDDLIAEDMAEAYGIKAQNGWLESLEELCERTGMDLDELLTPPASFHKRASGER